MRLGRELRRGLGYAVRGAHPAPDPDRTTGIEAAVGLAQTDEDWPEPPETPEP